MDSSTEAHGSGLPLQFGMHAAGDGTGRDESGPGVPARVGGTVELAPGVRVGRGVVRFSYARSGGPGGQSVNKLATKAEMRVSLEALPLSARALSRLRRLGGSRVTGDGELILTSESHRSQRRNREDCLERLRELLVRAMAEPKRRKKTKPSRGAVERRLKEKKERGEAKARRRRVE